MPEPETTWIVVAQSVVAYGIGPLIGCGTTILAYFLGRRSKVDEIVIKRRLERAEGLADAGLEFIECYKSIDDDFQRHYRDCTNATEAAKCLETSLYESDQQTIKRFFELRRKFHEQILLAKLYIRADVLSPFESFNASFYFVFLTDGIGLDDSYYECFIKTILDEKQRAQRVRDMGKILQNLSRLVKG